MAMEKRKAQRRQVKPKVGLAGTSGAGKTYSALRMAHGYTGDWSKICLIDTEAGRGELYANTNIRGIEIGEYDYIRLDPPFTPKRYIEAIKTAEADPNIEAIIIDSMSHAWAGTGGMLDMKDAYAKDSKENSFTAWRKVTPEHNNLVDAVLRSRCVLFATVRSKTEYVIEQVDGKQKPRKVGLAPVFRDGLEYEFTVFMEMSQEHYATASKDNTGIFEGIPYIPTEEHGKALHAWMESGKGEPISPPPITQPETNPQNTTVNNRQKNTNNTAQPGRGATAGNVNDIKWDNFWKSVGGMGFDEVYVHDFARTVFNKPDLQSIKEVITDQKQLNNFLSQLAKKKAGAA